MLTLNTKLSDLPKVGKATANKLKKIGLIYAQDLLWHFPYRFEDFSNLKPIADLKINETATVKGKIELISSRRARHRRLHLTECLISDETGSIKTIWFNQPYLHKYLNRGEEIYISGRVDDDYHNLQFTNPLWEKTEQHIHTGRIIPIYPTTQGISQKQLRQLIKIITPLLSNYQDYLPNIITNKYQLPSLNQALYNIHWPKTKNEFLLATKRLQFDELFFISLQKEKNKQLLAKQTAPTIPFHQEETRDLVKSLPFTLTVDQKKSAWEILKNISATQPMNRLLQGDVGSGKTVVAAIACLNCAVHKLQSIVLTPTEILAQQHYHTFLNTLKKFKLNICLFTRTQQKINDSNIKKSELKKFLSQGKVDIIIGTHALLQEKVAYTDIGLIIVDEQHRFGVEQRKKLKDKTKNTIPHFLSMTATPIPRTLALTIYGDLDISIIREKPQGRKKIITKIVAEQNRIQAYQFIANKIQAGGQAFVICPLIEESDRLGVKAATQEYEKLTTKIFPKFKIGLLHGKLKTAIKEKIMADFKNKKIDILVSTSVIEVGVDVPNANLIIIEGADRFGLAQLHQFRGRVGRSDIQSYCLLFTENQNQNTLHRLQAMTLYDDGIKLAEYDLKNRGSGELYGIKQSGFWDLKIADLNDWETIKNAREAAQKIITTSPHLDLYPLLKKEFANKYTFIHPE